jgi:hypothetical protein
MKVVYQIRTIQLLTIILLFSSSLYGQKDYEEGYVVNMRNDTLYGKIKDSKPGPFAVLYKKIRFKEEGALFTKRYTAEKIKGYKAGIRVYESIALEMESRLFRTRYLISPSSPKSFLKVVHSGKLSYYHWEYLDSESKTIDYIPLFHIDGRDEMVRVTQGILGLKREALSEYFNDCPTLVQKIQKREIRTPEEVIDLYGNICGRNKKF